MIEAKMPKDIRVYETKLIGPLTLRQTICLCLAIFVDIILYVTVIKPFHVNIRLVVYLIMFADVPIFAFTYKPMGMALEKYLKNVTLRSFMAPKTRKAKNVIYKINKSSLTEKQKKLKAKKEKKLVAEHPEYEGYK